MSGKYVIYFPRAIIYFPRALFLSHKYIEVLTYLFYVSSIYLLRKRFIQAGFDTSIIWLWARRSTDWATVAWMEKELQITYYKVRAGLASLNVVGLGPKQRDATGRVVTILRQISILIQTQPNRKPNSMGWKEFRPRFKRVLGLHLSRLSSASLRKVSGFGSVLLSWNLV